jgi:1-deoxy-D-xylulose-5-phosphate synthase
LVGEDGATHHGAYDLAYFRAIPNMTIAAPMNEKELRDLMFTAQVLKNGPFVIRYPKGRGVTEHWHLPFTYLEPGKGRLISDGEDLAVLSIGHVGNYLDEVRKRLLLQGISIAHYDMRFLKPIDETILHRVFKKFALIITVEDGTIVGGLGSTVLEFMAENGYSASIIRLGIPDKFIEHGSVEELHHECGYDADGIYNTILEAIRQSPKKMLVRNTSKN